MRKDDDENGINGKVLRRTHRIFTTHSLYYKLDQKKKREKKYAALWRRLLAQNTTRLASRIGANITTADRPRSTMKHAETINCTACVSQS